MTPSVAEQLTALNSSQCDQLRAELRNQLAGLNIAERCSLSLMVLNWLENPEGLRTADEKLLQMITSLAALAYSIVNVDLENLTE